VLSYQSFVLMYICGLSTSARFPAKLTSLTVTHRPLRDGRDAAVQKMRDFRSTLTANSSAFVPASNLPFKPPKLLFFINIFVDFAKFYQQRK